MSVHIILESDYDLRLKETIDLINDTEKDKIILNLRDEINVSDIDGPVLNVNIDTLNPNISKLSISDMEAVNAGAFEYIDIVKQKAEDIAFGEIPPNERRSGELFKKALKEYRSKSLFSDSINRAICSWNQTISLHAREKSRFFDFNRLTQTISFEDLFEDIHKFKEEHFGREISINLHTEKLHSNKKRILIYLFINRYQKEFGSCSIFSNAINYLWRDGYFKQFLNFFNSGNNLFILANNVEHLPKTSLEVFKTLKINETATNKRTKGFALKFKDGYTITDTNEFIFFFKNEAKDHFLEKILPDIFTEANGAYKKLLEIKQK